MAQHVFNDKVIPYVPGAPFLAAASLAFISLTLFVLVTTKADRDARMNDESAAPKTADVSDMGAADMP